MIYVLIILTVAVIFFGVIHWMVLTDIWEVISDIHKAIRRIAPAEPEGED